MPRLDGTRQAGKRQHEWGIVAQTASPRGPNDPYFELDFCELCQQYRIFDRAADTETLVRKLPDNLPELRWL